jgi:predicted nucleic acid-binding protein
MRYLLDTDTCVFALRGSESVRERLSAVDPEAVAISVVTLAELRMVPPALPNPKLTTRS